MPEHDNHLPLLGGDSLHGHLHMNGYTPATLSPTDGSVYKLSQFAELTLFIHRPRPALVSSPRGLTPCRVPRWSLISLLHP